MIENRKLASAAFGTHITPLIAAVMATKGDVVEFGMGDYSTPLLHEIIHSQRINGSDRKLVSFESDPDWLKNFADLASHWHSIMNVPDWNNVFLNNYNTSVLLIDHAPAEQRRLDILKYANSAKIIVVHDTDKMKYYDYGSAFETFQYVFTYKRYSKTTTLLSNYIDVTKLM